MVLNKSLIIIFSCLPFAVAALASITLPIDADLGWHLKQGEYFWKNHSILDENILSSMMPGHRYIASAWATDAIGYVVYKMGGFLGLSILSSAIISLGFLFISRALKMTFWTQGIIFPAALFILSPITEVSFRGQLWSFVGLGFLILCIVRFQEGEKSRIFYTVPLFMLWANFHGQFILGLAILVLWSLMRIFIQAVIIKASDAKHEAMLLGVNLLAVFAATLVNPFGFKIYSEVFKHFRDPMLHFVNEWKPFQTFSVAWWSLVGWSAAVLAAVSLAFKNRRFEFLIFSVPAFILLGFAFFERRYALPAVLISFPPVCYFISAWKAEFTNKRLAVGILLVGIYFYILFFKLPSENIFSMDWQLYCRMLRCSPATAELLMNQKVEGDIFTDYDFGGWLIWNYSDIKPAIDGRMHLWRDKNGNSILEKYYLFVNNKQDINESDFNAVYIKPGSPMANHLLELAMKGSWRLVYSDPISILFVRVEKESKY